MCASIQAKSNSKTIEVQTRENEMRPKLNVRTKAKIWIEALKRDCAPVHKQLTTWRRNKSYANDRSKEQSKKKIF